jgi:hypothetical protein
MLALDTYNAGMKKCHVEIESTTREYWVWGVASVGWAVGGHARARLVVRDEGSVDSELDLAPSLVASTVGRHRKFKFGSLGKPRSL